MAHILVADDDEGVRTFLAEALELDGHEVETAPDGVTALELASRRAFDVVITDLTMPRMDGMTLLRRVKEDSPEVEVILLTAFGSIESAVAAMRTGAFDYLTKPLSSPAELRVCVARAVERKSLLDLRESATRARPEVRLSFGSLAMARVEDVLRKVAPTNATVLLLGESGTGKEVAARFLHDASPRRDAPFVAVNCAALSEALLESELFGHEKGAFTGASAQRRGRIELAQGGTFFLDEIGELKPTLQSKLLRVIQERAYERVGGTRTLIADVRWVAATNRDLGSMIRDGSFREDLYHRLAVMPVRLPPLRERSDDLVPLARALLASLARDMGRSRVVLADDAEAALLSHTFAGNVRELRNTLERAAILANGDVIRAADLLLDATIRAPSTGLADRADSAPTLSLDALEKRAIRDALAAHGGNRKLAAEALGIGLRTLYEKLKRHALE